MSFMKKGKDKEKSVSKKTLDKYLPTTLFFGIQKDISDKALKGYIHSLAKTAFENLNDVKYSFKKINKNEYLYELHNGSIDLSYTNLVYQKLFVDSSEGEIILKTERNNVRVTRKASGKIDTNILLEHNSREDEAQIDKESKARMTPIIKDSLGLFVTASLLVLVTGSLAAVSFVTKYSMMNEDYSFEYKVDHSVSPMKFVNSLKFNDHSDHKYLKSIVYSNGSWKEEYGIVEKKKIDINAPKKEDINNVVEMNGDVEPFDYTPKSKNKPVVTMEKVIELKPVVTMEKVTTVKPVVTMEEIVTLKPVVTMEKFISEPIESVEINKINDIVVVKPKQYKKEKFEIIDMETLDDLDLSNLPENVVIEEGK